jgi:hypothetical protein
LVKSAVRSSVRARSGSAAAFRARRPVRPQSARRFHATAEVQHPAIVCDRQPERNARVLGDPAIAEAIDDVAE